MKSKIPCPPAFIPVIRFDHATGLCGGILVVKRRNDPCAASRAKFGILPSAMNFVSRSGSSPSTPRIIIFRDPTAPPRSCRQEKSRPKPARHEASRHTSRKRFLKGAITTSMICKCDPASRRRQRAFAVTDGWRSRHHHETADPKEQVHRLYFTLT